MSDRDHTFIGDFINHSQLQNCLPAFDRATERAIAKERQTAAVNSEQSSRLRQCMETR